MNLPESLQSKIEEQGQSQVLRFWDQLDEAEQQQLLGQLSDIDWDQLAALHQGGSNAESGGSKAARAQAPPAIRLDDSSGEISMADAIAKGNELLANGEVGMILVAGGQGTRLGFDQPKGTFPLGPVSGRTLFQILIDQLRARSARAGHDIPLYVMTSPATDSATREFLEENKRFGLAPDLLKIFCQGTMPAVDEKSGDLLLSEKNSLALSPDGHGGMLAAFHKSGCFQDAKDRGVKHLFYAQIDNPLVSVCDPSLLGFHALSGSEMTTQVVRKVDPQEKVGNVVEIDGKVQIIEYSDLPAEMAEQTDESGGLKLWAGNIAVHVFRFDFLERVSGMADALPFHLANKKVPYLNDSGELIEPESPNAIKYERFIFDLLPHAENAIVVEADKETSFAPVKNANGAPSDTPELSQKAILSLHRQWLTAAGVEVPEACRVEIDPLFAIDAEEVADKKGELPSIDSDLFITQVK